LTTLDKHFTNKKTTQLYIALHNSTKSLTTLFNTFQKTFTKTIANQNFNIADLKSGVYFVKAVDASNIEKTSKLIKQ
jgi:hypothetical protein